MPLASGELSLPCPDWVFSSSNVHVAKDRSWFGNDYTPVKSVLDGGILVEGIGTVELPTKRSPSSSGPNGHAILRLSNVLHVPTGICNILGSPLSEEYKVTTDFGASKGSIRDQQGRSLAYFRAASPRGLLAVRLSGPPVGPEVGPSPLGGPDVYHISVTWPEVEKQKWAAYQARIKASASTGHDLRLGALAAQADGTEPPCTTEGVATTSTEPTGRAADSSNLPSKGLEKPVDKPFTRLSNGTWLHDRPEKDVYRLLIDAYRMRMENNYMYGHENTPGSVYAGAPDGLSSFRRFLQLANAQPGLLPAWWDREKQVACERLGMDPDEWCDLRCCIENHDIIEHYGDPLFPMQLRMFGEAVYRRGPGGVDGAEMLRQMVMQERGDGSG